MKKVDWRLCLVADVDAAAGRNLPNLVHDAAKSGVTMVQLRAKGLDTDAFSNSAYEIHQLLKPLEIPFLINDRIDIAQDCQADGVHLGQGDVPIEQARKILGEGKLIGISASTIQEAKTAEASGADYLGVGPIYYTDSKSDLPDILGIAGFKAIRNEVNIPLLAIGGINATNVMALFKAGADGVAVISAILRASDVGKATQDLLSAAAISRL